MAATWKRFKIWDYWRHTTQVLGGALLAMKAESGRMHDDSPKRLTSGKSALTLQKEQYLSILNSPSTLCGMALQTYCGLVEEHARDVLRELHRIGTSTKHLMDKKHSSFETQIEHYPPPNGIEAWGAPLLAIVGRAWSDVKFTVGEIVEVWVIRNAFAHGAPAVTGRMINRVANAKGSLCWKEGESIVLSYDDVRVYRDRVRSFARVLADATAQRISEYDARQTPSRQRKIKGMRGPAAQSKRQRGR